MRDIATPPIDSAHLAARELADESRTARPGTNTLRKIGFAFWTVAILLMSTVSAPATARNATSLPWSTAPSPVIVTESKTLSSGDPPLSGTRYLTNRGKASGTVVVT